MIDKLTFRPANISDMHQFVDMMNNHYARKKTPDYFYWQFIYSYEPAVLMCAFEGSKMAGMFGLKMRRLSNGAIAGQVIDMLIAPEWRGKNVFCKLAEQAVLHFDKKFDILCVFANAAGSQAVQKALGWQLAGAIRTFCLEGDADVPSRQPDMPSRTDAERVRFEKNNDYRQWRFDKSPEYSYYNVTTDKTSGAWIKVFIDPQTGRRFGDIVDIQCDGGSGIRLYDILKAACGYMQAKDVELITLWALPDTVLRSVAESVGFKETNQERFFCIKIVNPDYEYLDNFSAWQLVQADAEIF